MVVKCQKNQQQTTQQLYTSDCDMWFVVRSLPEGEKESQHLHESRQQSDKKQKWQTESSTKSCVNVMPCSYSDLYKHPNERMAFHNNQFLLFSIEYCTNFFFRLPFTHTNTFRSFKRSRYIFSMKIITHLISVNFSAYCAIW